jgi:hypothetical protein
LRKFIIFLNRKISHLPRFYLLTGIVALCFTFNFSQVSWSQQVTLAWDPNTEPDVAGYIAYWGTFSRNYAYLTDVGNNSTHTIKGLAANQVYYFAITAYDSDYNESAYSEELAYVTTGDVDSPIDGDSSSGGCFIATAAFGSPLAKQVVILRRFRDKFLLPNTLGRSVVAYYYKYSPPLADAIAARDHLRKIVRWSLLPFIGLCRVILTLGLWPALTVFVMSIGFMVSTPFVFRKR